MIAALAVALVLTTPDPTPREALTTETVAYVIDLAGCEAQLGATHYEQLRDELTRVGVDGEVTDALYAEAQAMFDRELTPEQRRDAFTYRHCMNLARNHAERINALVETVMGLDKAR